jgi:hypothetical protein
MKITGKKTRSLAERNEISFCASGSINNITGSGVFGVSGATQNLEFSFTKGKIYDPENKYFGSYTPDKNFAVSGNLSGTKYDYYIGDENTFFDFHPISYKGARTDEKIKGFYFDASGCEMDITPFVGADEYPYNFVFPAEFISGAPWTGSLNAEGTSDTFEIFSGKANTPASWAITGFDAGRRTSADIKLQSSNELSLDTSYIVDFDLYTNFGVLNKVVTGMAVSSTPFAGSAFTLSSINNFSQTGTYWNSSSVSTGNYSLDYTLVKNRVGISSDKPIEIRLTDNYNSSGNVKTGYLVTGVQLRGRYQNGFFLDTPTVTFSSNEDGDTQATGTAKMADYMVADFYSGTTTPTLVPDMTGIVVKTITGIEITNSGSYLTPTGISVSFSHPSTAVFYPDPCPYYKYTRLPLAASSAGVNYQGETARQHWYYDNTRPNDNLYSELSGVDFGAVALAGSGSGVYDRELTGIWQVVTGTSTSQEKYGFNVVDAAWGSGADEINHPDGVKTGVDGEYYDSGKVDDSSIQVRLKCYLPKNKVSITSENELQISGDPKYQSNYAAATVSQDYYSHYPELRTLISSDLYGGGTGAINLSYSFIKSGTTGILSNGTTAGVYQDIVYTSTGSEPSLTKSQITGQVVSGFIQWKELLEGVYTGLTIDFINNGLETGTSVPVKIGENTYSIPHASEANIGDIRVGMISGASDTILGWTIITGGVLNVSGDEVGDITLNNDQRYRLDSDTTNVNDCYSLKYIFTHEIGHALGFGHDRDKSGIMHYSIGSSDSMAVNFPNDLSGSYRNQDMIRNYYSYTKNPDHEILKSKREKGHRDKMSVNIFITGSGSGLNQIISGVTPSGYST